MKQLQNMRCHLRTVFMLIAGLGNHEQAIFRTVEG